MMNAISIGWQSRVYGRLNLQTRQVVINHNQKKELRLKRMAFATLALSYRREGARVISAAMLYSVMVPAASMPPSPPGDFGNSGSLQSMSRI